MLIAHLFRCWNWSSISSLTSQLGFADHFLIRMVAAVPPYLRIGSERSTSTIHIPINTMALQFFRTPLRFTSIPPEGPKFICQACKRNASTFKRTRKALRVKPDPSFEPSKTETQDHIIFNPPSSAPNVYHTPSKFLPITDPRSRLQSLSKASTSSSSSPSDPISRSKQLGRPLRPVYEKKYDLGKPEIEEMRKLRQEDPRQWTRVRLAEKFQCSQFFVSIATSSTPEIRAEMSRELEAIKRRWGPRKTEAREGRKARKALWGRDS